MKIKLRYKGGAGSGFIGHPGGIGGPGNPGGSQSIGGKGGNIAVDPDANTKIKLQYRDGEYLTGYAVRSNEAKLLEKIGLTTYMDGWGYFVEDATVKALGTEFLYSQALEYVRPAIEAKLAEVNAEKVHTTQIFAEAARTGKPVVLRRYTTECNLEDCSMDNITVYAMPDGKTKTTQSHNY